MSMQVMTVNKHVALRVQTSMKGMGKTGLMILEPGTKLIYIGLVTNPITKNTLAVVQAGATSAPFVIPYDQPKMPIEWEEEQQYKD